MGRHAVVDLDKTQEFRRAVDELREEFDMSLEQIAVSARLDRFLNGPSRGSRAEVLAEHYRSKPSSEMHLAVTKLLAHKKRRWVPWAEIEGRVLDYLSVHPGHGVRQLAKNVTGSTARLREAVDRLVESGSVRADGAWPPAPGRGAALYLSAEPEPNGPRPTSAAEAWALERAARRESTAAEAPEGSGLIRATSGGPATLRAEKTGADHLEVARTALWTASENLSKSATNPPSGLAPYLREAHEREMKGLADAVVNILSRLE